MPRILLFSLLFLVKSLNSCLPTTPKCQTNTCIMIPPSPPSYIMAPMLSSSSSMMSSPPSQYSMAPPPQSYSHGGGGGMMMGSQTPFVSPLDPPLPPVSSSTYSNPSLMKNQYELSPEIPRWDRQEPEYKHVDETVEAVVAPDVIVADTVDEKSTDSEKVEKVHENERLARMDLKYEEPEPTPFDNGTVTFHAWFVRKL